MDYQRLVVAFPILSIINCWMGPLAEREGFPLAERYCVELPSWIDSQQPELMKHGWMVQ